jgi:hypothetical protein
MTDWFETRFTPRPVDRREQVRKASSRYAAKRGSEGMVRVAVWVPEADADRLRSVAATMVRDAEERTRHAGSSDRESCMRVDSS